MEFSLSIGAYMVTRYADLVAVLDDPRTFSSRAALPMIYDNPPEVTDVLRAGGVPETTMVVNEDEPDHIRVPPRLRRRVHRRAGAGHGPAHAGARHRADRRLLRRAG